MNGEDRSAEAWAATRGSATCKMPHSGLLMNDFSYQDLVDRVRDAGHTLVVFDQGELHDQAEDECKMFIDIPIAQAPHFVCLMEYGWLPSNQLIG